MAAHLWHYKHSNSNKKLLTPNESHFAKFNIKVTHNITHNYTVEPMYYKNGHLCHDGPKKKKKKKINGCNREVAALEKLAKCTIYGVLPLGA